MYQFQLTFLLDKSMDEDESSQVDVKWKKDSLAHSH